MFSSSFAVLEQVADRVVVDHDVQISAGNRDVGVACGHPHFGQRPAIQVPAGAGRGRGRQAVGRVHETDEYNVRMTVGR